MAKIGETPSNPMKIIILADGRGERLMPLNRNMPKPWLDMSIVDTMPPASRACAGDRDALVNT